MSTAATVSPLTARALIIDSLPIDESLQRSFCRSHWSLEYVASPQAAIESIRANAVPVLLCDAGVWRETKRALAGVPNPPGLLVFARGAGDAEEFAVLRSGAHYVDTGNLSAHKLFSLMNHAWRRWNGE